MNAAAGEYKVEFTARARKQLKKMDRFDARIIASWIKDNLEGCTNPRAFGKGLTANRPGEWRYRVGAYRILALINDGTITIEVLSIGHRREIYRDF
ncbi:type II toxin-antitoxin system RelE family toxin [Corynebacterium lujinxingii]|uniref:Type II toxin-antitoxin system RelE/ParE family toxin n=1 Tax=Corynebacterium lujinxingii TaxID=2763010 RepID=A0A7H0K118_9CORY|nr:type II toxin-antitoxin system RelE/ParE family toxin [Corynebacterium lujinxingii]MBC3178434.1 type II toxin-antitoxin system RelE/ParE family toxin [Corynebacterium lujinxingii]NNO10631.1 type II toxin-antitoxin system RelE/ParE family toxin [Corynebacterium lujinxingii]QNP90984.1 type II toxin-antitoxin system RelE/ParE family toxin [Corynebacterium lujinxingii]